MDFPSFIQTDMLYPCSYWFSHYQLTIDQDVINFLKRKLWIFLTFAVLTFVLDAQKNRLIEIFLMSTQNICFVWEIRKQILSIYFYLETLRQTFHAEKLCSRRHFGTFHKFFKKIDGGFHPYFKINCSVYCLTMSVVGIPCFDEKNHLVVNT